MQRRDQRGIFLITFALWAVVLLGIGGAALDAGRLFVNRNEVQSFADAAALAAAQRLDGTPAGLRAARDAVHSGGNLWDFGTRVLEKTNVEFSTLEAPDQWQVQPSDPSGFTRVRVTAEVQQRLFFAPLFIVRNLQLVRVRAVAEQTRASQYKQGLWPFSVLAFKGQREPHFGLEPGGQYTIRYSAGRGCAGDERDASHLQRGMSRTWWGRNGEAVLRERIVSGSQDPSEQAALGKPLPDVNMPLAAGAAMIEARRAQDTDASSPSYSAYQAGGAGNGRRVVVIPIQDSELNVVRSFGMFFLLPAAGDGGQNQPWCAEYVGKAFVPNSSRPGGGAPGAYAIRLVR